MRLRVGKALALAVSGAALGLQLLAIQPVGGFEGTWYWPFVNYPMYAGVRFAGDSVHVRQLRVRPCEGDAVRVFTFDDVHLWPSEFDLQLRRIARGAAPDPRLREVARGAVDRIDRRLQRYGGGGICRAEVWEKAAILDRALEDARRARWRRVHRWEVGRPERGPRAEP